MNGISKKCMTICNMQIVSCMMNRSLCIIGMRSMSIRSINLKMEKKTFGRVETDGYLRDWRRCYRICQRSEEHTSELQSRENLVCRLLLEKKKQRRTRL